MGKQKYQDTWIRQGISMELNNELLNLCKNGQATLTGSRYYGGNNSDSDWDYIINENSLTVSLYKEISQVINNHKKYIKINHLCNQENFNSIYVLADNDQYYNLIILSERDFSIWIKASNKLKIMAKEILSEIWDKDLRVALFITVFNYYKKVEK